ncbi:hypothetical protein NW762_008312 [Fusarium torreyae]|uniref:Ubiquitin 3 binding protein But2 C-terminal domain-containing protein n=1 Tax=Fusarium torreyae TaxID=1237075 RepID=A0A9W8VDJ9_9HYPO|nr:hypothetical protein NW762_008312 [Fusarium torreyae]
MPSFTHVLTTLACLLAVTSAAPTVAPRASGKCPTTGKTTRHEPSALYNVFPGAPDLSKTSIGFHVETYKNASQVEQLLVFKDIPSNAKECSVGWKQGNRPDRVFIAKGGDALTEVRQLSGFPDKSVTYKTVKEFDTATEAVGAADFTNWDDLEPQSHIIGGIDCKSTIYLKAALRNPDGNTKVFLEQNSQNGLHIEYSC